MLCRLSWGVMQAKRGLERVNCPLLCGSNVEKDLYAQNAVIAGSKEDEEKSLQSSEVFLHTSALPDQFENP
jgi:hypothetical protein